MSNKTQPTNKTVLSVFQSISENTQRQDCEKLLELYKKTLRETPVVWGDRIIGFGQCTNTSTEVVVRGHGLCQVLRLANTHLHYILCVI